MYVSCVCSMYALHISSVYIVLLSKLMPGIIRVVTFFIVKIVITLVLVWPALEFWPENRLEFSRSGISLLLRLQATNRMAKAARCGDVVGINTYVHMNDRNVGIYYIMVHTRHVLVKWMNTHWKISGKLNWL